ncbi:hypothetical protein STENM223S_03163 [Streptomyces tendae]
MRRARAAHMNGEPGGWEAGRLAFERPQQRHTLRPGAYVSLRGGRGTDSDAQNVVYRQNRTFIWNNDKDTIHFHKPSGSAPTSTPAPRRPTTATATATSPSTADPPTPGTAPAAGRPPPALRLHHRLLAVGEGHTAGALDCDRAAISAARLRHPGPRPSRGSPRPAPGRPLG